MEKGKVRTVCIDVIVPASIDDDSLDEDLWAMCDWGDIAKALQDSWSGQALGSYVKDDGLSYYNEVYGDLVDTANEMELSLTESRRSRKIKKESKTSGWWNKYYNKVSDDDALDYAGGETIEDASVEYNDNYNFTHVAWLLGKDDYMEDLEEDGYGLLELAKDNDDSSVKPYFLVGDRVFEISESDILSIISERD